LQCVRMLGFCHHPVGTGTTCFSLQTALAGREHAHATSPGHERPSSVQIISGCRLRRLLSGSNGFMDTACDTATSGTHLLCWAIHVYLDERRPWCAPAKRFVTFLPRFMLRGNTEPRQYSRKILLASDMCQNLDAFGSARNFKARVKHAHDFVHAPSGLFIVHAGVANFGHVLLAVLHVRRIDLRCLQATTTRRPWL
jgi:hypothetical protein